MEDFLEGMTEEEALRILERTQYLEDSDFELPEDSSSESDEAPPPLKPILGVVEDKTAPDLGELKVFAKTFRQRRIKLGFTQGAVGLAMGKLYGNNFSQKTISRFETLNLPFENMCKLKPLLQKWLEGMDKAPAIPGVSTIPLTTPKATVQHRRKHTSLKMSMGVALEKAFVCNPKPPLEEIALLAESLSMEKEVVRVWFRNRRQKEKKRIEAKPINPPGAAIGNPALITSSPSMFTSQAIAARTSAAAAIAASMGDPVSSLSLVASSANPLEH